MKHSLPDEGICFEPLEPRLLLSGTWGTGADGAVSEARTKLDGGFNQATVAAATAVETSQTGATGGTVDLLGEAPALNFVESANSEAAPTIAPTEPHNHTSLTLLQRITQQYSLNSIVHDAS